MQVELLMYLMTELEVQGKQQEGKSEVRKKVILLSSGIPRIDQNI